MKCLKCFKSTNNKPKVGYNSILAHLEPWYVCDNCDNTGEYASKYYHKNKAHYRELHKKYKDKLTDSYVANCLADRTILKGSDIPQDIIQGKRQYMRMKKHLKEDSNV